MTIHPLLFAGSIIVAFLLGIFIVYLAIAWVYSESKPRKQKANYPPIEDFENSMYWGKIQ
jgi:cbb3-type cytochrome oxidase subunit 3